MAHSHQYPDLETDASVEDSDQIAHYDAAIVFAQKNREDALNIMDEMNGIDLGKGENPKVCLHSDPIKAASDIAAGGVITKCCTLVLVLATSELDEDEVAQLIKDEALGNTRLAKKCHPDLKYCVRPLYLEKDMKPPMGLSSICGVDWWDRDSKFFKRSLKQIFNQHLCYRKRRERDQRLKYEARQMMPRNYLPNMYFPIGFPNASYSDKTGTNQVSNEKRNTDQMCVSGSGGNMRNDVPITQSTLPSNDSGIASHMVSNMATGNYMHNAEYHSPFDNQNIQNPNPSAEESGGSSKKSGSGGFEPTTEALSNQESDSANRPTEGPPTQRFIQQETSGSSSSSAASAASGTNGRSSERTGTNGRSSERPGTNDRSSERPGTNGRSSERPGTNGRSSETLGTNDRSSERPGTNDRSSERPGTNGRPSEGTGTNGRPSEETRTNGGSSEGTPDEQPVIGHGTSSSQSLPLDSDGEASISFTSGNDTSGLEGVAAQGEREQNDDVEGLTEIIYTRKSSAAQTSESLGLGTSTETLTMDGGALSRRMMQPAAAGGVPQGSAPVVLHYHNHYYGPGGTPLLQQGVAIQGNPLNPPEPSSQNKHTSPINIVGCSHVQIGVNTFQKDGTPTMPESLREMPETTLPSGPPPSYSVTDPTFKEYLSNQIQNQSSNFDLEQTEIKKVFRDGQQVVNEDMSQRGIEIDAGPDIQTDNVLETPEINTGDFSSLQVSSLSSNACLQDLMPSEDMNTTPVKPHISAKPVCRLFCKHTRRQKMYLTAVRRLVPVGGPSEASSAYSDLD